MVISIIAFLALIVGGSIYIFRGIRALIHPNYYKVLPSDGGDNPPEIKRAKEDMNHNPILRGQIKHIAISNLLAGIAVLALGIFLLLKFFILENALWDFFQHWVG